MRKIPPRKKKPKKASVLKRKVHIGDQEWYWQYNGSVILIQSPDRIKHQIEETEFLHLWYPSVTWDDLERANRKGYYQAYATTPSRVKEYIEKKLLTTSI